jgi:hypothetical protein
MQFQGEFIDLEDIDRLFFALIKELLYSDVCISSI